MFPTKMLRTNKDKTFEPMNHSLFSLVFYISEKWNLLNNEQYLVKLCTSYPTFIRFLSTTAFNLEIRFTDINVCNYLLSSRFPTSIVCNHKSIEQEITEMRVHSRLKIEKHIHSLKWEVGMRFAELY